MAEKTEEMTMKSKTIIAAGVALGLMVLAPAFVQAGGGGAGIPINVFAVDCYVINGVNPDIDVSLDDQFFGTDPATGGQAPLPRRSPVNLGKAKLLCTNSIVGVTSPDTFASNLNAQGELTDHLVCYEMPAQL